MILNPPAYAAVDFPLRIQNRMLCTRQTASGPGEAGEGCRGPADEDGGLVGTRRWTSASFSAAVGQGRRRRGFSAPRPPSRPVTWFCLRIHLKGFIPIPRIAVRDDLPSPAAARLPVISSRPSSKAVPPLHGHTLRLGCHHVAGYGLVQHPPPARSMRHDPPSC